MQLNTKDTTKLMQINNVLIKISKTLPEQEQKELKQSSDDLHDIIQKLLA